MGLSLVVGPANAGKVALLLDRYLDALDRDPVLIVPNRSDVDRVERDLLRRRPALLSGSIGTFDDLFERLAFAGDPRPLAGDAQRALLVRRAVARPRLEGLAGSSRFGGFADALAATLAELDGGLLDPAALEGDVAALYGAYRAELDGAGLWDRGLLRRHAVERIRSDLGAWDGAPVFAYGFEDLTGAEWGLLEALAGRAEVHVSLPYEPGRPAFASLERTAGDLVRLADGGVAELPAGSSRFAPPSLAHLERTLFSDGARPEAPPLDGALRFLEGAGGRATLELVGEEILALLEGGTEPAAVAVVCPSLERVRGPLETAFTGLGIPYAVEGRVRLGGTPLGQALLALLRFAWLGGGRRELFAFLRSPYSGMPRPGVDFLEGRLRGRAVVEAERVEAEAIRLRDGQPLPPLERLRAASSPVEAVRALAASMLRSAYGLERPPAERAALLDLRAQDAVARVLDELDGWAARGGRLDADDVVGALERCEVRLGAPAEPGRVAVLDLRRARTRHFEAVFVLGLEQGSLPRRDQASPFLGDDVRRELDARGARLLRPDPVARERYLFYTACTRATRRLVLVREAAGDEGGPREPSPFWEEVRSLFDPQEVERATRRRPLSHLTWPIERAPTDRERLRALALLHAAEPRAAAALAAANGWERRLARARRAFDRPTRLRSPLVLEQLGARGTFNVTELERMGDCSSAWFVERFLSPRTIDGEPDAKLRGSLAHTTLSRFYGGLQKRLPGRERVTPEVLEEALVFLRECLDGALEGVRLSLTDLQRAELGQGLWRDLEQFVRTEAESDSPFVPRHLEYSFGLDLDDGMTLTGKIDRVDVDPFAARGIVQDYKSGKHAHSAKQIADEGRLQIPLYLLVARDLVGIEPVGGLYRPLAGERRARGMLRAGEDGVDGVRGDLLSEGDFWSQVEGARELAVGLAGRIRAGDVRHDPRGGECPAWCDLWPICRKARA